VAILSSKKLEKIHLNLGGLKLSNNIIL
jgi:hypothetical protein